jgi:glycine/D-amino acid oxidase-like deaminating enzyme
MPRAADDKSKRAMMGISRGAEITICGAGIAGIAAAYFLSKGSNPEEILLIDERPPLTLTSDKSTEAYRNWWPGPDASMIALMNRSIDLMEELARASGNYFQLNRRGYLYATAIPERVEHFIAAAERASQDGAGPLRIHRGGAEDPTYIPSAVEGYQDEPSGCDLIVDQDLIRAYFPYLTERTLAVLHARRCGWFSGQQLGMLLFESALKRGVRFLQAAVEGVAMGHGKVKGVQIRLNGTPFLLPTRIFINAAGPMLQNVAEMLGLRLPVFCERHLKICFRDTMKILPREVPLLIWEDPQQLSWSDEERHLLSESEEDRALLSALPAGIHVRPEGGLNGENLLLLWPYDLEPVRPIFPLPIPLSHAEVVLRGLTTMIPGMSVYIGHMLKPLIDGGYYTKTPENRLLCGPLPVGGAYVLGALSGYGLMAACGAGDLLAAIILSDILPSYAASFSLERYNDPLYQEKIKHWEIFGQL